LFGCNCKIQSHTSQRYAVHVNCMWQFWGLLETGWQKEAEENLGSRKGTPIEFYAWCTKKQSQLHRNPTKKVTILCKMSQMTTTFNDVIARGGNRIALEIFTNKVTLSRNCTHIVMIAKMKKIEIMMMNYTILFQPAPLVCSFPIFYFCWCL